jgi:hypothetical protein
VYQQKLRLNSIPVKYGHWPSPGIAPAGIATESFDSAPAAFQK